jgi:exosortase
LILIPLSAAWALAPDLGHGWAAPLLIGYLYWERWAERPIVRPQSKLGWTWWLAAPFLAVVTLPLQLLLVPYPLWAALVWGYEAILIGTTLAAAGRLSGAPGVRWLGGPLIILAGAVPWLTQIDQHVILPLRGAIAGIAAEVCNLLGRPALALGTTVRLGNGWVGVDEACGGIRSLQASVMIALFFGEWFRLSWLRRAALVAIGIAAALLGNFCRVIFLSLQATRGADAFHAVHDTAGWFALAFSLALTGFAAWYWARARAAASAVPAQRSPEGDARPVSLWLCVVFGLFLLDVACVQVWYAQGEAGNAARPHWTANLPTESWNFRPAPLAEASREILRPDSYTAGSWQEGNDLRLSAYYVEWRQGTIARTIPFLHNPTVCLPYSGCELVRSLGVIPVRWVGGVIPFHAYIFREAGEELVVAFSVWDTARNIPLERRSNSHKWIDWFQFQWKEVREARRDQPAQLLSIAISGKGAQDRLYPELQSLIVQP